MTNSSLLIGLGPTSQPSIVDKQSHFWRVMMSNLLRWLGILVLLSPSIFALIYYSTFASDRFVSESKFVLRSATQQAVGGGLSSILKLVGISSTQGDVHALVEYLTSPDAIRKLQETNDLRATYGRKNVDLISRYPNLVYDSSEERFYEYLETRIKVSLNPNSNITSLHVEAFTSQDSFRINQQLLMLGEAFINDMNERIRKDTIKFSESEVALANERLRIAERELTSFRNREAILDPGQNSTIILGLIAQLSTELNSSEIELVQTNTDSPQNPRSTIIKTRIAALKRQIEGEQSRLTAGDRSLASIIAEFEKLTLDKQFAADSLSLALTSLEQAKADARKQQLYLETIVQPNNPDSAVQPQRIFEIFSLVALNLLLLLVVWLLKNGIAEHAPRIVRRT